MNLCAAPLSQRRTGGPMRFVLLVSLAFFGASVFAAEPARLKSFDVDAMDRSVEACEDFYAFACGNWEKANPIPPDQSRWGRFDKLREYNLALLRDILEKAAAKGA